MLQDDRRSGHRLAEGVDDGTAEVAVDGDRARRNRCTRASASTAARAIRIVVILMATFLTPGLSDVYAGD